MVVPDAEAEMFPGFLVTVHEPDDGKPLKTTPPVDREHVGGVIAPTMGAEGICGAVFMTTLPETGELQPKELVTMKV